MYKNEIKIKLAIKLNNNKKQDYFLNKRQKPKKEKGTTSLSDFAPIQMILTIFKFLK